MTREEVYQAIEKVEHPEIAATLVELGMILDISVQGQTATVAMALPTLGIPEMVQVALSDSLRQPIENLGLKMEVEFFEMTDQAKNNFFQVAQARWKGSI